MQIHRLPRVLFASAAACIGILSLSYNDLAPAWNSVPNTLSGRGALVNGCAIILLVGSVGLCFMRTALPSIVAISGYYALWALASAPPLFHDVLSFGSWYGVCEAATSLAGAWILFDTLQTGTRTHSLNQSASDGRRLQAARIVFGLTCIFYGCSHFAFAALTADFVPTWLPNRVGFAYITGVCHIAGGLGVTFGILPRLAATLEAAMMTLFGLLVWVPSLFTQPRPTWAGNTQNQWSEIIVNLALAAAAWVIVDSLRNRAWGFIFRSRQAL